MSRLFGCEITKFNDNECKDILKWLRGNQRPQGLQDEFEWALIHCSDGVCWGYFRDGWHLGCHAFPGYSPHIEEYNLMDLRIFGARAEILIWRNEGVMAGRLLRDVDHVVEGSSLKPADETRVLVGDRLLDGPRDSFSRVGIAAGQEQVVPLACANGDFRAGRWPLRLKVRHYFEQDHKSGALRVAATRLVDLYKENGNGA